MIAPFITAPNLFAALLALIPYLAAAFFPSASCASVHKLPQWARFACPSLLCIPYALVTLAARDFRYSWFALYALLPVAMAVLLWHAHRIDRAQRGNWRDFFVLAVIGLSVDLRWFEAAWPAHLAIFNKILLLDAGIYAFLAIRRLDGVGFDLRLRLADLGIGLREVAFYTPIALAIGLGLGFLHLHAVWRGVGAIAFAWFFTFFFIAVPEELFFRGWLQNLLERRIGRYPALFLTAALFGLAHFNKQTVGFKVLFNWRYVLLAAIAGVFYGRAWRSRQRVGASAVTHATVDSIWSLWLR
jgi:membrane protease YdiL (CAAX protease family)